MCTVILVTWLMLVNYIWHIYAHTSPYIHIRYELYITYLCNMGGKFVSGTWIAIKFEKGVVGGCVFGTCIHQCNIYMPVQNGSSVSYICSVAAIFFSDIHQ